MIEPNENPSPAAKRELFEETGYKSNQWAGLDTYAVVPNRGVSKVNLFLARNSQKISIPDRDDLEEQELVKMTCGDLASALIAGKFKVLQADTAIAEAASGRSSMIRHADAQDQLGFCSAAVKSQPDSRFAYLAGSAFKPSLSISGARLSAKKPNHRT